MCADKNKVNMQMQLDCAVSTDSQALSKNRGTEEKRARMKGGLMKTRVGVYNESRVGEEQREA